MLETDPTPEEIAIRSAEVRATWSEAERLRRLEGIDVLTFATPMDGETEQAAEIRLRPKHCYLSDSNHKRKQGTTK